MKRVRRDVPDKPQLRQLKLLSREKAPGIDDRAERREQRKRQRDDRRQPKGPSSRLPWTHYWYY